MFQLNQIHLLHVQNCDLYKIQLLSFDNEDGKLAFLHEKELVLNQEDTENILSAVSAVRTLGPNLFKQIEKVYKTLLKWNY